MRWTFKDSKGEIITCDMGKLEGGHTTEEDECSTLLWAMQSIRSLGFHKVIFERDNQLQSILWLFLN